MAKFLISRTVKLDANGNGVDHVGGSVVIVATLSIGPSVDITWIDGSGNESGVAQGVLSGQKAHAGDEFAGIKLKGQANDVCSLYVGPNDASLDSINALNAVIGHVIVDNEIEVKNDAGNPLVVNVPNAQLLADNADAQAAAGAASLQGVVARLQAWNGATFDRLKVSAAIAGALLSDIGDRAARVLGVVTIGAAEKIADNADAQAAAGAAALQGVVSRLMAWNGATFDRLKIGATAGSLLTDLADRAARVVGVVSGSLGSLVQIAVNQVNYLRVQLQGHGDAETDADHAFIAMVNLAAVGAQYGHTQVIAGALKVLYVDKIQVASSAAELFIHGRLDAALTDIAAIPNRRIGGAAATSHYRSGTNGAQLITANMGIVQISGAETKTIVFDPPIKLAATQGYAVENGTVNQAQRVTWFVREYDA